MEKKAEALQSTNSELQSFNYTISHEIKAPVRAIDGYARIFIEDYSAKIDEEGLALISNIRNICGDTLLLINRLLEYTKFADAEPIKEIIDFKALIQAVFEELILGNARRDSVQLQFKEALPVILGDHILMKQVITNIISNSLKFTRNKEAALIEVGYIAQDDEGIFYIKDNGVGFDMKFSENLFGLFQRMHSQNDFEGSGLGLAIAKKLIHKFGGRIWIESEVGKGACTYFTIGYENILK